MPQNETVTKRPSVEIPHDLDFIQGDDVGDDKGHLRAPLPDPVKSCPPVRKIEDIRNQH